MDKHAWQQRPPRSPPSRLVDVAATRRPCQDTNGRTKERTDRQTPGIEFGASVTSGGNNFNEFSDN